MKNVSIMYDLSGLGLEKICFTNSETEVEQLKEKGFNIYLNPCSEDGIKLNVKFYVLGIAKNLA